MACMKPPWPEMGHSPDPAMVNVRCGGCRTEGHIPIEFIPLMPPNSFLPHRGEDGVRIGVCHQCVHRFELPTCEVHGIPEGALLFEPALAP